MKSKLLYIVLLVIYMAVSACSDSGPDAPDTSISRTVLVYMAADNSLGSQFGVDERNINQMKNAVADGVLNGGRLLVFHDSYGTAGSPRLIEITTDGETVIKTYSEDNSSTDPEFMRQVLDDAAVAAPARSNWLVLWSHGTGWIETEACGESKAAPFSFGEDKNPVKREMSVRALAGALGNGRYDVLYFDCCFMGCIEVVYELRHAAKQIVASATELPVEGMPYDVNVPVMFTAEGTAADVAANTLNYYKSSPEATNSSCTIAVIETSQLDNLAAVSREVMLSGVLAAPSYTGVRFYRYGGANSRTCDMGHYYSSLNIAPDLMAKWSAAYSQAVSYSGCTPKCYGLDMTGFTGLGTYIVRSAGDARIDGYSNQSWWKDVVSFNPSLQN